MISRIAVENRFLILWLALLGSLVGVLLYQEMPLELLPASESRSFGVVFARESGTAKQNLELNQALMNQVLLQAGVRTNLVSEASSQGTQVSFSVPPGTALARRDLEALIQSVMRLRGQSSRFKVIDLGPESLPSAEIVVRPVNPNDPALVNFSERLIRELEGLEAVATASIMGIPNGIVEVFQSTHTPQPGFSLGKQLGWLALDMGAHIGARNSAGQGIEWQPPSWPKGFVGQPRSDHTLSGVWLDGHAASMIFLWRKPDFNDLDVSKGLEAVLRQNIDSRFETTIVSETSRYIVEAEDNVMSNLMIGIALTCICIVLFVRYFWATALVSISIPLALVLSIPILHFLGVTRNVMSLAGAALGVGIVVDATLGTMNSFNKRLRIGFLPVSCALHASNDNQIPLLVTSLSTLAVFVPILFLGGLVGDLFWDLSLTVIVGQVVGFFVSVYLMPSIACLLHEKKQSHLSVMKSEQVMSSPKKTRVAWSMHLERLLLRPRWCLSLHLGLAASLLLVILAAPPSEFLPVGSSEQFSAVVHVGDKSKLSAENRVQVRERLDSLLQGHGFTNRLIRDSGDKILATATHTLDPNLLQLNQDLSKRMGDSYRSGLYRINPLDPRSKEGQDIEVFFDARSDRSALRSLDREMQSLAGVIGTQVSWDSLALVAGLDSERSGLYAAWVPATEQSALLQVLAAPAPLGVISSHWRDRLTSMPWLRSVFGMGSDHLLEFRSMLPEGHRLTDDITLPTGILAQGISLERQPAAAHSVNQRPLLKYSIDIDGRPSGAIEAALESMAAARGLDFLWHPRSAESLDGFMDLLLCLASAIVIIALIIFAQTRSVVLSVVVLGTFLWGPIGSIPGLILHGEALSASALVGFILLAGTIVNNGILLVDQIVRNRNAQMEPVRACIEAAKQRSVPVIVTSLTTILGTLPLVFETGAGSQMYRGLAIVVVYGTAFSTPISLVGVPSLVLLLGASREWLVRLSLRLRVCLDAFVSARETSRIGAA
jgi:HAE1 family hydrophobic/amphiphilic exporter-1